MRVCSSKTMCLSFTLVVALTLGRQALAADKAKDSKKEKICVHVDSYHAGYEWSDGLDQGVDTALKGVCKVERIFMDTKRQSSPEYLKAKGLEVKKFIEDKHADIVIVSDDNAAAEVLQTHFKDSKIPFVFCGLNWSIEKYGLPYKNTTGMIEVALVQSMFFEVRKVLKPFKTMSFLSADTETERKEFNQIAKIAKAVGVTTKPIWVKDFASWKQGFVDAQNEDFVFYSNSAGITDWKEDEALAWVKEHHKKLSSTTNIWLKDFTAFTFAKVPFEQGDWAGQAAKKILKRRKPASTIPIVTNKQYTLYVNTELHGKSNVKLSDSLLKKAKKD